MIKSSTQLANALALTALVTWVICSLFVLILPQLSVTLANAMIHAPGHYGDFSLTWGNFISGGVAWIVSGWVFGYVLGWSLEKIK